MLFRSLRSAKAPLSGTETIRTIKRGHIHHKQRRVLGDTAFINGLLNDAALFLATPRPALKTAGVNATVPYQIVLIRRAEA